MSSSNTVKEVNSLKQSLIKHREKAQNESNPTADEQILDILSNLDKCSVDVNVLAETLIGQTVSKLKTNPNTTIAAKAKTLVKKWKQLAKQSGIGPGKKKDPPSRSSSLSSVTSTTTSSSTVPHSNLKGSGSASIAPSTSPEKTSSSQSSSITQWDHLPPARKNSAIKLHQTFLQSKQSLLKKELLEDGNAIFINRATEVEAAIQTFSKGNKKAYIDKIRSLIFNLKKNEPLRDDIVLGHKSPTQLVSMSTKDLQTVEKAKERSEQAAALQGSRRLDWEQANAKKINEMCGIKGDLLKASLFTCGRCKSHKTTSTQKQTRSADEPMTVFVFCENCGNRWKC